MKKTLFACLALLFATLSARGAQPVSVYSTDGYYRVQNYATERYTYVTDNTDNSDIARNAFDMAAIQLWKDLDRAISDPASIIYIEQHGTDHYDLRAQGTGVYAMLGMYVNVKASSSPAFKSLGLYEVSATGSFGGVTATKYLSDGEQASVPDGVMSLNGTGQYRQWAVFPVSATDEDNYFGITPTIMVGTKHYYPFYAAFPFNFHSAGMKAYIVTKVDDKMGMAVMTEVTGAVPASTPVLIECSSALATNNRLDLLASSGAALSGNLLKGVYFCNQKRPKSKDALTAFDANTMRVLGVTAGGELGFVSQSTNLKTFSNKEGSYLPANQAYLPVSEGTPSELKLVTEAEYQEALANMEYTITYMVDGVAYETQSYKAGAEVSALANPQKEGYTFSGWDGVPTEMPDHDVVVTGSFSVNSYTLTYVLDGETYQTFTIVYGEQPTTVTVPDREGYTFSGWEGLPSTMPANDVTVTGSYIVNTYTLTYVLDGETYGTFTVAYGEHPTIVPDPTREGYTFEGWEGIPGTMPAHDVVVTGHFTPISAIRDIAVDGSHVVYTLSGRRVPMNVVRKGIYIIDGKKVVIK